MGGEHRRPVQHAGDVDVDRPSYEVGVGVGVGLGQRADGAEQAGVVHPEVDAAVSSHDRRREGVEGGAVGHVDGGGDRRLGGLDVAVLCRGPGAGGQDGAVAGAQAQVHPRRREVHGQAGAQAAAGARHDGDAAADHQAVWRTDRSRRYVAASTRASKGRWSRRSSGCHCTPSTKRADGSSTASMTPSVVAAVARSPGRGHGWPGGASSAPWGSGRRRRRRWFPAPSRRRGR